ncbi:hypothetical protein BGZ61DRAFT_480082 [Ilyonectria robusta]|uniref:uncharacterized protein n=1 Tax=Ilyonectria robusta TaxID=1079257 RepID=UPI001E8D3178|nr:uncharacterized protein BGZ61DRAFT_480082 [Ilyonectria robusta]KAH8685342.1 hypothetical protein BGZ61DRAFT_480082 [Ilyonectria robusta]
MKDLIRSLQYERAQFRRTWQFLLGGLVDDVELLKLLDEPHDKTWQAVLKDGLEQKLLDRLGEENHIFKESVFAIARGLQTLSLVVGMEGTDLTGKGDLETHKAVPLNKSHIALLDTLSNENTKLKSLVKDCIELEPVRAKSSLCSGIPWVSLRHWSLSLYDAMATRWCCDCQYPHHALFRLELRNDAQVDAFNLSFLRDFDPATGHSAVRKFECHSMEIDALELDESGGNARVKFKNNSSPDRLSKSRTEMEIRCLCAELKLGKEGSCLGFVPTSDFRHYVHCVSREFHDTPASLSSLFDILSQQRSTIRLHQHEKYQLAAQLAMSVLQFHTTPWLPERWTSQDVVFLGADASRNPADLTHISKSFLPKGSSHSQAKRRAPRKFIKNETIFSLGLALVEISTGTPLELRIPDRSETDTTELEAAEQMLQEMETRVQEVPEYISVVRSCLYPGSFLPSSTLDDKTSREEYVSRVIGPLVELVQRLKSVKP